MKPVDQTITDSGRGNCLAACVASILELDISEVPNFAKHADVEDFHQAFGAYLNTKWLWPLRIYLGDLEDEHIYVQTPDDTWVIVSGKSPRGDVDHAIVGRIDGWNIELVHDPHPDKTWIEGSPTWVTFLIKL